MMNFAIFRCCPTSIFLKQYESSTDAILRKLGIDFIDIKEFNCCGYPLKNIDFKAYVLSSARNLALARQRNVAILTFCNCCYNTIKHVLHLLREDAVLLGDVNTALAQEGLQCTPDVKVLHLLEALHKEIGIETIKSKQVHTFKDLKIAVHYGCHILRPADIMQFDNPIAPTIFDQLVEVTGARSISWDTKLECCGSPVWGVDDELSMDLSARKLDDAARCGADFLCSACVFCQLQFDRVQKIMIARRGGRKPLPSILYTQLLGLVLGLDEKDLGIAQNELDSTGIRRFIL
jgi:heterodisulfide reductase subunit B